MVIEHNGPAMRWRLSFRNKTANGNNWSSRLKARYEQVKDFPNWERLAGPRCDGPSDPRSGNGLVVSLLQMDHVLVVKVDILRSQPVGNGIMQRVRGLRHLHGLGEEFDRLEMSKGEWQPLDLCSYLRLESATFVRRY